MYTPPVTQFNNTSVFFPENEEDSSSYTLLVTCVSMVALTLLFGYLRGVFAPRWGETRRDQLGRLARTHIPYVARKYRETIDKESKSAIRTLEEQWKPYGDPILQLPNEGWSEEMLKNLVDTYASLTLKGVQDKQFSGAIYPCELINDNASSSSHSQLIPIQKDAKKVVSSTDFHEHSQKMQRVFTYAFSKANLWNPLHSGEFPVGSFISYQVVRIVADLFGGDPKEVKGFVTSGGTESLMLAMRCYRNRGMRERGHKPGEGVIIAGESVHAAVMKAAETYLLKVVFVRTDKSGNIDMDNLRELAHLHRKKLIAIVGSTPSYPTGIIDKISEMASIASRYDCGMHVDCCLGGFVVNEIDPENTKFLQIPGVTSLSADTHKNGGAPKGSSVLVTKNLGVRNLAYYSIYAVPDWRGCIYGTPKDEGSQSCIGSLSALLALLGTGKTGYSERALLIRDAGDQIKNAIKDVDALELVENQPNNIVAFGTKDGWIPQSGASYILAHEMEHRNFVLSALKDNLLHFCLTPRFVNDPKNIERFIEALNDSIATIYSKVENNEPIEKGNAGMYGALNAALEPDFSNSPGVKYVENFLLGPTGSKDAVREFFLAQL